MTTTTEDMRARPPLRQQPAPDIAGEAIACILHQQRANLAMSVPMHSMAAGTRP
ncbi:MAG: hypothetical protein QM581_14535 [Pseudomonas sp.]